MKFLTLFALLLLQIVYASDDVITSPYEACKDQVLVKEDAYKKNKKKWDVCGNVLVTPDIGLTSINPLNEGAKYLLFSHKVAAKVIENLDKSKKYADCSASCFAGAPVCIDIENKKPIKCAERKTEIKEAMIVYARKIRMELALAQDSSDLINVNINNVISFAYTHKERLINGNLRDFEMGTPNPVGRTELTKHERQEAERRRDYELKKIEDENAARGNVNYSDWQAIKLMDRFDQHKDQYRKLIYEDAPIFSVIEDTKKFDEKNNPIWTDEQLASAFKKLSASANLTKEKVNWSLKNGKLEFERDNGEAIKKWFTSLSSKNTDTNDLLFYVGMKNQVEDVLKDDPSLCSVATAMESRLRTKDMQNTGILITASLGASVGGRVAGGAFNIFRAVSGAELAKLSGLAMGSSYIGSNFQKYGSRSAEAATRSGLDKTKEGAKLRDASEIESAREQLKYSVALAPIDIAGGVSVVKRVSSSISLEKKAAPAMVKYAPTISSTTEEVAKTALKPRSIVHTQPKIGSATGVLDSIPLPKDMRLSKFKNEAGEEFLMYEKVVRNAKGELEIQKRELPIDKMTNALDANYPAVKEYMEDLIKAKGNQATLAFIDVNNLGYVNNNFVKGRAAGDEYLKQVAKAIERATEGKGQLFKLGGDEYGVIISEADPVKAQKILQRMVDEAYSPEVHKIFRENSILKAQAVRDSRQMGADGKLLPIYTEVKEAFKEYAPYSKEGISIGATTIRPGDNLESLLKAAEAQAVKQKIVTKENLNISAKKYGGAEATPGAIPKLNYKPKADLPAVSDIKATNSQFSMTPNINAVRNSVAETPGKEKFRFGEVAVLEYPLPDGSSVQRYNRYYTKTDGSRDYVTRELVYNSKTNLIDASHESGKYVMTQLTEGRGALANNRGMIWINAENLGKINYFKDPKGIKEGTSIGDEYLKYVADTVKKELGEKGVPIKLSGSEFVGLQDNLNPRLIKEVQSKVQKALENHPGIKKIYSDQIQYLEQEISRTKTLVATPENQKRLAELTVNLASTKKMKPEFSIESTMIKGEDNYDSAMRATRGKRYP
jgi:GGDEF domain-containing protein